MDGLNPDTEIIDLEGDVKDSFIGGTENVRRCSCKHEDSSDQRVPPQSSSACKTNKEERGTNSTIKIKGNVTGSMIGGRKNVIKTGYCEYCENKKQEETVASTSTPNANEITSMLKQVTLEDQVEHGISNYTGLPKCYRMESEPRGNCLIINNEIFPGGKDRKGSEYDAKGLETLFEKMKFKVVVEKNLTAKAMGVALRDFANRDDHSKMDAGIIVILSHGDENGISGTDGKLLELQLILNLFNNKNCRQLIDKPKLFFIQACRAGIKDKGVFVADYQVEADAIHVENRVPTLTDMLISYSTVPGFAAMRNEYSGSWYGQALIKSFEEIGQEEIEDILKKVDEKVQLSSGYFQVNRKLEHAYQATSRELIGWNKKLYFNVKLN